MTKLNFARPNLRYNDNLRRELSRNLTRPDAIAAHHRHLSNLVPPPPKRPKHIERFEALPVHKQAVINHLLGAWGDQVDAFAAYLPIILGKKSKGKKKALEVAKTRLIQGGAVFMCESIQELAADECGVWDWLQGFARGRDVHWQMQMQDLREVLFQESLPLCVDWAKANQPTLIAAAERLSARVG